MLRLRVYVSDSQWAESTALHRSVPLELAYREWSAKEKFCRQTNRVEVCPGPYVSQLNRSSLPPAGQLTQIMGSKGLARPDEVECNEVRSGSRGSEDGHVSWRCPLRFFQRLRVGKNSQRRCMTVMLGPPTGTMMRADEKKVEIWYCAE